LPFPQDPNVLSSFHNQDDSAVYRLSDETALVQTVDYITPVVDDPYTFGAVAAANALSDIYAMGARPVTALNLVGFPVKTLPLSWLEAILRGGADKVMEAGASLVGGHSIDDHEPKYGLSVTGLVHPEGIIRKKGALPGDRLVLTKPLGIGIITTGIDRELVSQDIIEQVTAVMLKLNKDASLAMQQVGVHAATDVTGFGLLGHLHELLVASEVGAKISLEKVPILQETWELARQGVIPDGSHNNYRYLADTVTWDTAITPDAQMILCDAQTSGGLLIAVAPEKAEILMDQLIKRGVMDAAIIGEVIPDHIGAIQVSN
jgi:selenide,water dikinase